MVNEKIDVMAKELPNLVEVEDVRLWTVWSWRWSRRSSGTRRASAVDINTANVVKLRRAAVGVEAAE